ncbi:hypothetical protein MNV49_001509 [Pseudohyphozyma bogoriensis]|nr:hypothetical protein MNV49_001509 [Pseudohyphozyma bogoriensis]
MRAYPLYFLPLAFAAKSNAGPPTLGGTFNNALQASILQGAAHLLSPGAYTIENVATGQKLSYNPDGNHISPTGSEGSAVTITHYGGSTAWVRLAIGEKDKSAKKHKGKHFPASSRAKSKSKQAPSVFFIIPTDHLIDMKTMALTGSSINTFGDTTSTALALLDPTDKRQQWRISKHNTDGVQA